MVALIAGKGPSFSTMDWSKAPEYRIGINEAGLYVPDCTAIAALDSGVLDLLIEHAPSNAMIWTTYCIQGLTVRTWQGFKKGDETVACAIRMCDAIGITEIQFIGCDAMSYTVEDHLAEGVPYADEIKIRDSARVDSNYNPLIKKIWRALYDTKIQPTWLHTKDVLVNPFNK